MSDNSLMPFGSHDFIADANAAAIAIGQASNVTALATSSVLDGLVSFGSALGVAQALDPQQAIAAINVHAFATGGNLNSQQNFGTGFQGPGQSLVAGNEFASSLNTGGLIPAGQFDWL